MSAPTPPGGLSVRLAQDGPVPLDVTLDCAAGELHALCGPSGSGKTSVLRAVAGLQAVARGRVTCGDDVWLDTGDGRDDRDDRGDASAGGRGATNRPPHRRRVGYVFQHYALFPHLSARANLTLAMGHRPRGERTARADALLARVNMEGLGERRPAALSGGQRQRVALARALAREPDVLLLDEPFSAVDQQTRRRLHRELARLRRSLDIPMILVTHDLGEVQQLADSLSVIHRGRTLQSGAVDDVVRHPGTRTVARLLGHQNLFRARVVEREGPLTRYAVGRTTLVGTRADPRAEHAVGAPVTLLVPPSAIRLAPVGGTPTADETALAPPGETWTPFAARVSEAIALGDELSLRLRLDDVEKSLRLRVPRDLAARLDLAPGAPLVARVRADAVHVMRAEEDADDGTGSGAHASRAARPDGDRRTIDA